MVTIDFVEATARGYSFVWKHRAYLAHLAVPVFFLKLLSFFIIFLLDLNHNYLRQGLILLPSYVLEGVFLIGLVRYAAYGEAISLWFYPTRGPDTPYTPKQISYPPYFNRPINLQLGVAIYTLFKMLKSLLVGLMDIEAMQEMQAGAPQQPSFLNFLVFAAIIIGFTWCFRMFWIYIPAALGHSMFDYLKKTENFRNATSLITAYLMAWLPFSIALLLLIQIVASLLTNTAAKILFAYTIQATGEIMIGSIIILTMTYAIRQILEGKPEKKP